MTLDPPPLLHPILRSSPSRGFFYSNLRQLYNRKEEGRNLLPAASRPLLWSHFWPMHEAERKPVIIVAQLLSRVWLSAIPWTAAHQAPLSFTISQNLFKLMSFEPVILSTRLIFCYPLLLLPSIFPSIRVFPNESALRIRWPKYWSFSFSISPSHEYSGLISFRIDWFDLLAVQGALKSLL